MVDESQVVGQMCLAIEFLYLQLQIKRVGTREKGDRRSYIVLIRTSSEPTE